MRPWKPPLKAISPGRPVTRRASFSAASIASDPEFAKNTVSSGSGHDVGDHLGQPADRLQVAQRVADVQELVDLLVDRLRHRRVVMAERGRRDAGREVEVVTAGGVDQLVAFAAVPRTLEVAAEDRRQVRRREGLVVGRGVRGGGVARSTAVFIGRV